MSASIYGVLARSSATPDQIRSLLSEPPVKVSDYTYDGGELYKALNQRFRWLRPGNDPAEDSVLVWGQDYPELTPVTAPNGKPAYLYVQTAEDFEGDGYPVALLLEA